MSMFDQIEAPNIALVGSSKHYEHALSSINDGELNTSLGDKFTDAFTDYIYSKSFHEKSTLQDFYTLFPFNMIKCTMQIKNNFVDQPLTDIYLKSFLPIQPSQVFEGKGIDMS